MVPLKAFILFSFGLLLCHPPVFAQREFGVNGYILYTGFDYFNSPGLSLSRRGFDTDFGVTVKPWVAIGGDFSAAANSIVSGGGTINGSSTVYAPVLATAAGPVAPPPNGVNVLFKSTRYTFAFGLQFYWRRLRQVTFLGGPGLGEFMRQRTRPATSVGRVATARQRSVAKCSPNGYAFVLRLGRWRRPQRVQTGRSACYSRLDQYASFLQLTRQPTKLSPRYGRSHVSPGPSEVADDRIP